MHDELAKLVYPVLDHGLDLRARLHAGEQPDLDYEQALLRDMLLAENDDPRGFDPAHQRLRAAWLGKPEHAGDSSRFGDNFAGARYALVCWLDEMFTDATRWGTRWNEQKLEMELYGTNDRAWNFWEQARLAQRKRDHDALEVFYLCAMLGFRGQLREKPAELESWIARTKVSLGQVEQPDWPQAVELDPPCEVPPLRGRDRLRRMAMTAWVLALVAIPLVTFTLVRTLAD